MMSLILKKKHKNKLVVCFAKKKKTVQDTKIAISVSIEDVSSSDVH